MRERETERDRQTDRQTDRDRETDEPMGAKQTALRTNTTDCWEQK